ncbi:MAG: hypothetical protein KIT87_23055 [Anaerolineae bacterium]|nr:hypothetical protein [Anaerolineae bacterium]
MPSNADLVLQFHKAVGDTPPTTPTPPTPAVLDLRETLIREEYEETLRALDTLRGALARGEASDLAPLAHELADLLYVVYGTFVALGIDADAVFRAVHRANMHKTTGPKRADGKQMKPADWQPADVTGVIEQLRRTP